jgi:hypothetical protein
MTGQLELVVEVSSIGGDPGAQLTIAGLRVAERPQKAELLAFCRRLREKLEAGDEIPPKAMLLFVGPLRAGSQLDLSHQESEAVCETLRLQPWHAIRLLYARAALKRWPGEPVFELHALEAKHEEAFRRLSGAEIERAERAAERARSSGDVRTAHRLRTLLLEPTFVPPFLDEDLVPMPDSPGAGIDDAELDALIESLRAGPMRGEIKDLERWFGRERLREMVLEMLGDTLPDMGDLLPLPLPRRKPRPAGRKERTARQGPGPASPEPGAASPDKPDSDQLDLFE